MARCFPFPPPGFTGKSPSNEALILSIKLQQEKEKSNLDKERDNIKSSSDKKKKDKKERKKEKKEKKEKKRKEKEERRASSGCNNEKQKLVENMLYQADKSVVVPNVSEQLERSNVTEEHGRPYLLNGSSSTDSTGNSCKRKRLPVPPNAIQGNGNIIRICLSSSHKREEPSTSGSKEQEISVPLHRRADHHTASISKVQPCSNVLRTETLRTEPSIVKRDATVKAPPPLGLSRVPYTSTAGTQPVPRQDNKTPTTSLPVVPKEKKHSSSRDKKLQKKQSKYEKLFDRWAPMSLDTGLVVGDEGDADDWLMGSAKRIKTTSETQNSAGDNFPSCASFALQPRSQMLPDADIYALPFTVPF